MTPRQATTARARRGLLALTLTLALGTTLSSCSVEGEQEGLAAGSPPASTSPAPGASPTPPGGSADAAEDLETSATGTSMTEPGDEASDPTTDDATAPGAVPQQTEAGAGESSVKDQSSEPGDQDVPPTASAVPTERALPADAPADDPVPPGFSTADSVLTEDAFDGPDLRLAAVTTSDDGVHEIVFLLEGNGYPGWQAEYVDPAPSTDASTLRVHLVGVHAASSAGDLPESPDLRIEQDDPVDGDMSMLVDLDQEPAPFRVHLQHSPLRIVVEITQED